MISDAAIDRIGAREGETFRTANPKSLALAKRAEASWFQGVPFHWMLDWPSPAPLVAEKALGATLTTVDGRALDDFCLGETASMFGHSPPALVNALAEQAGQGLSYMLPTYKTAELGEMLSAMFGLPFWQVTTTASEANRAVIRWCRAITERRKILVFNGCYHGAVDDVFVDLRGGLPVMRGSLVGQVHDLRDSSVVIEFNDEAALEQALSSGDIACVLAEPVMTNIGMVRDAPGYLQKLRQLCTHAGTLLVFDETHTISSGYGGHSNAYGPTADIMVIGKSIGGGVPCAVYGFTGKVATEMARVNAARPTGHSGIGTTLSAGALSISAMHAMLGQVITQKAYAHMLSMADRLCNGLQAIIARHGLQWHISAVGARVEFVCGAEPAANGSQAKALMHAKLEAVLHLYLLNRGILLAPFHNMMLLSPVTSEQQVDRLLHELGNVVAELLEIDHD